MTGAITDHRLLPLADAVKAGQFDVLSVDIFDTLLWRRVPEPKDIFALAGTKLVEAGLLRSGVSPVVFQALRASAEKAARAVQEARTGSREVLLPDIYAALPDHIWTGSDARARAIEIELDVEAGAMVLDCQLAGLMDQAKAAGVKVILSSDTYFARNDLVRFLTGAGLTQDRIPDTLYISSEHGRPKWRDLFALILKDLNIAPEKLVHVGDNVDADVAPCVSRGIASVHYEKWSGLPRARAHEVTKENKARADWLNHGGDLGLTGLRSRLANRPPADLAADLHSYWIYGAVTLAPVFAAYGRWVVDTMDQEGASQVYGIMREGRFLNRVVETVAAGMGQQIATTELWMSRRAVVRAALWADDFSYLPQAIAYCPGPTTDDILAQLGLVRADLSGTFKDVNAVDLHAPGGVEALMIAISRSQSLQAKIAEESQRRRTGLIAYLKTHVAPDIGKAVVLDLGYAGTIQTALQKILAREGWNTTLTGLYVAVNEKGGENVRAGSDLRALFGSDGYDAPLARVLERTPDVLEHACMCEEGSLDSFDEDGIPVFLPSQRDGNQIRQMEAMQDGIIAGVGAIISQLGEQTGVPSSFVQHAGHIVLQAMLRPTRNETDTIGRWLHEANFDLSDRRALADLRIDPATLEFGDAGTWLNIQRQEAYWPAAAFKLYAPHWVGPYAMAHEGSQAADDIAPLQVLGLIQITPDFGVGYDEKRCVTVPMSVSAQGRGFVHAEIKPFGGGAIQSLKISWPQETAILAVRSCLISARGETQLQRFAFMHDALFTVGPEKTQGFAILGPDYHQSELNLAESISPWPHALDIELKFAYHRLGPIYSSTTK